MRHEIQVLQNLFGRFCVAVINTGSQLALLVFWYWPREDGAAGSGGGSGLPEN